MCTIGWDFTKSSDRHVCTNSFHQLTQMLPDMFRWPAVSAMDGQKNFVYLYFGSRELSTKSNQNESAKQATVPLIDGLFNGVVALRKTEHFCVLIHELAAFHSFTMGCFLSCFLSPGSVLLNGDVEFFLEIGTLCSDMKSHERALDQLIDLVSKDQVCQCLQCASALNVRMGLNGACQVYFFFEVLISDDNTCTVVLVFNGCSECFKLLPSLLIQAFAYPNGWLKRLCNVITISDQKE